MANPLLARRSHPGEFSPPFRLRRVGRGSRRVQTFAAGKNRLKPLPSALPAQTRRVLHGARALRRGAKSDDPRGAIRQVHARLIQQIERVQADPQPDAFGDRHILEETRVHTGNPWPLDRLAAPRVESAVEGDQLNSPILKRYVDIVVVVQIRIGRRTGGRCGIDLPRRRRVVL